MGRDASGRLNTAYSATENSYNIEKKIVLHVVLPVFWVSSIRCCGFVVVFSSHAHFMTTILSS